jgi:hypothetical protein
MNQATSTRRSNAHKPGCNLRAAFLRIFAEPDCLPQERLSHLPAHEWQRLLPWLDESGLALYLFAYLEATGQRNLLPATIYTRLAQNLHDNTERNNGLLAETIAINHAFAHGGVSFASLKGITLSPESVPDSALRCQLDLDFLVATEHVAIAAKVLERFGYTSHCISGDTWEFKAGDATVASIKNLYKAKPQRSAELHLAPASGSLSRTQPRIYSGASILVLAPPDLFAAQAAHLFKHLCSSFTRCAWLLEFHRHILARRNDDHFWSALDRLISNDPQTSLAIAVSAKLSQYIFATGLPPSITLLIATHLPASAELWIENYGLAYLLANHPGSKLNRLLQSVLVHHFHALELGPTPRLIPRRLPPMITSNTKDETLISRLRRLFIQSRFILFRLRFHIVEGARYGVERMRFRRQLAGLSS